DREGRPDGGMHSGTCVRRQCPTAALETPVRGKAIERRVDGDGIGVARTVVTRENAHRLRFGSLESAVDRPKRRDARSRACRVASYRRDENAVAFADDAGVVDRRSPRVEVAERRVWPAVERTVG